VQVGRPAVRRENHIALGLRLPHATERYKETMMQGLVAASSCPYKRWSSELKVVRQTTASHDMLHDQDVAEHAFLKQTRFCNSRSTAFACVKRGTMQS
jgi:hypothetical protein